MRPSDDIETLLTQTPIQTNPAVDKIVLDDAVRAMAKSQPMMPASDRPEVWRLLMKSKITQFAAVAVIIIAVTLSVTIWEPSAYALEQTIKAYDGLRYIHVKDFVDGEPEPREFWVELVEQGQVKQFRASLPAWAEQEGPLVAVWKEGTLQIRGTQNDAIVTKPADTLGLELLNIVKGIDPRSVVEELRQFEAEGKVEMTTSEPSRPSDPIVIKAKYRLPSPDAGQMVLFVDQQTKLVTRVLFNRPENGHRHSWEFSDYNVAVDERVFLLEPTSEIAATFMKTINAKLASLDINNSTVNDVTAVLGEPWAYKFQGKRLDKDNLPEAYTMTYPGGFMVVIYQRQVMQWGCQQLPGDEIPGYTLLDSIRIGSTLAHVFETLGSPTNVIEGFGGEDNRVMSEDNTVYANMNTEERNGFCFTRYDDQGKAVKIYLDDNVLYKDLLNSQGLCFYGTVSQGKRVRFSFMDNKVAALYEYRTEPINTKDN